jgi:hypothetical protein
MEFQPFSTGHLDYLQRVGEDLKRLPSVAPVVAPLPRSRRLWRIHGVGFIEKGLEGSAWKRIRPPTEDLLIGLYPYRTPLAFLVSGTPRGAAIHIGTWLPYTTENSTDAILDERQQMLKAALRSLYPAIDLASADPPSVPLPVAGLALGVPTMKAPHPLDNALPLDRLIRALAGTTWSALVLAQPLDESVVRGLRHQVINEMRRVQGEAQGMKTPSPLAGLYAKLLAANLESLNSGLEGGTWRTGVYLQGEEGSYRRLASIWRAVFSGPKSIPEPIRVWDDPTAAEMAARWALPDIPRMQGPGVYQYPFEYQTLLSSSQLAAYVHLPQLETCGFSISLVPAFDAMPPAVKGEAPVRLGRVAVRTEPTETEYAVDRNKLTRHAFVAGVTGSGKTNTIFHILKQSAATGVPFLVIEPAKKEYRALLNAPGFGGRLRVFTPGDETVSPFRMNPFEVPAGTPVGVHVDMLRSVFSVSFGMWTPLPQVLERCLYGIYEDRGWNLATGANPRVDPASDVSMAFPTLSDLLDKVDDVVARLGYEKRVSDDIHAALHTRINSLRVGGKGRMLDTARSMPMDALVEQPAVLELDGIGDDDDKAFLMGLIFIRLAEHRRTLGEARELRHLLVIEEAHRLLSGARKGVMEQEADPRGKAVETFANILSEIRAYGQGVIIADQVPVKLVSDVIKNTNLKIAHRLVDLEDRTVLAGAMAMSNTQAQALSILKVGQVAVFGDGDDSPVLVQVPPVKDLEDLAVPGDADVSACMRKAGRGIADPRGRDASHGPTDPQADDVAAAARRLVETREFRRHFSRLVLAAVEDDAAPDRCWPDIIGHVSAVLRPSMDGGALLGCVIGKSADWFSRHRGAQSGWTYANVALVRTRLQVLLLALSDGADPKPALGAFRSSFLSLHARPFPPFSFCERVCTNAPPVCLYRYPVEDLVATGVLVDIWQGALTRDRSEGRSSSRTWEACLDAAQILLGHLAPPEMTRRAGLCYAQRMLHEGGNWLPEVRNHLLEKLRKTADTWRPVGQNG